MAKIRHQERSHKKASHNDPLSIAVSERDADVMRLVQYALDKKQVMLAYQPIVQANATDKPAFYEGLIRVMDQTGRIIPAREFIDQIENHEMGRIVDCLALELGLQALHEEPSLRLSINMSAQSIGYPRWTRTLKRGLRNDPTVGDRLILEITERSAMIMPDIVKVFMSNLQSHGVSFALDDFGAGTTAFRYLKEFHFDIMKIDGQFIRGVHNDPDNQVLVAALVSIAQQFDMFTVAELVETERDAKFLANSGIDCLQGYYFGRPTISPYWLKNQYRERRAG